MTEPDITAANATPTGMAPWHPGERAMQRLAGVTEEHAARAAGAISGEMREQPRLFYPSLPFVVVGAVDLEGRPWATLAAGRPGFLSAPDPATLHVAAARDPGDPADQGLEDGDAVGLLGIELATRRRNRLNGAVRRSGPDGIAVRVAQSFGNCPRFIMPRRHVFARLPDSPACGGVRWSRRLDAEARALIGAARTLFVATYIDGADGVRQVDASHRGGPPGFVHVGGDGTLTIPDFAGNGYFNTLGNIWLNGRAGLLFLDFPTGSALQVSGAAEVHAGEHAALHWTVTPDHVVFRKDAVPLRWEGD